MGAVLPFENVEPDSIGFAPKAWATWEGFTHLPKRLAKYGLDSQELEIHPYAEDAGRLWDAQFAWIQSYIDTYYAADADIAQDMELGKFVASVVNGLGKAPDSVLAEYRLA